MEEIKIFAPATVANISCGFDVLGCCLDSIGDEMILKKNDLNKLRILKVTGQDLPLEIEKNVASVAIMAMLKSLGSTQGFDIIIDKKIKPGSGIGSSAASSAGAVYAANKLLGDPFTNKELIAFAMEGERLASGNAHADNVAPALLGGFSLVKSYDPLEIVPLPTPGQLRVVILHPLIELNTKYSRSLISESVNLKDAVSQWGNVGALVSALYTEDYELFGRSLVDKIIEPFRSTLIPFFNELKEIALKNGALGFGISGSGPSVFAMCKGDTIALEVNNALELFYKEKGIEFNLYNSKINTQGIKII
jgi:homoserine kinase